jgi:hypothetical protein
MSRILLTAILAALTPASMAAQASLSPEQLQKIKAATVKVLASVPGAKTSSSGSGFVVRTDGDTAYVVTNDHVIDMTDTVPGVDPEKVKLEVVFDSGTPKMRSVKATVAAADPLTDLAVLKLTGVKDAPKPFDLTEPPKVQETLEVLVCGFPFGQANIDIGKASVSSIRTDPVSGRVLYVQLTGALNPGNSGGPILTADGKLVGVAVMTIRNAGKGLAIPQEQVTGMLRGRPGPIRLMPAGEGMAKIEIELIDPLGKAKTVSAHFKAAGPMELVMRPDRLEILPGATKLPLTVKDGKAAGELKLPSGARSELLVQVEMDVADGKVLTLPILVPVAGPQPVTPGFSPRGMKFQLPAGQTLPQPTLRRPPGADDTLTDLIGKPEAFVGKSVEFDALSSGSITQQGDKYELEIETDADRAPSNLRPIVAKDLALQLTDLGVSNFPYKFAVRVKGKVEKPVGRDDRYLIEVGEITFLDPAGKVVSVFKPEPTPPSGPPSLLTVNRFPEQFVGKVLTIEGYVMGTKYAGQGLPLEVANKNGALPMNLEFYTSKDLHTLLASGVPNGGAAAKLTLSVERVDAKTGKGIVGVTKAELSDEKKTYASSEKVSFPSAGAAARPKAPAAEKTSGQAATQPPAPAVTRPEATSTDAGGGNLLLYGMIGAAIFAGLCGSGVALLLLRKKATTGPQYGAAKEKAEPAPKAKTRAKPVRPSSDWGTANSSQNEFPGFDFENK